MLTLLAPFLAQVVTASVGARLEGRVIATDTTYYEAAARPSAAVDFGSQRAHLLLQYSPSFTLTPLDSNPDLLIFHSGGVSASYGWRRTTLSVGEFVGYGDLNFRVAATAGSPTPTTMLQTGTPTTGTGTPTTGTGTPTTGTGTPTTGTGGTPTTGQGIGAGQAVTQDIRYISSTTSVGVGHLLSSSTSLQFGLAYIVAGSLDAATKAVYPTVRGPLATASVGHQIDRTNRVSASLSLQNSSAATQTAESDTAIAGTQESWSHDFNPFTSTTLGAGVSGGRNSRSDGYVAYSIYPTFVGTISHVIELFPGSLALAFSASSAPAVDPTTLVIDPRVALVASVGWQRERWSANLVGTTAFSVSGHQRNAFSSVGGGAGLAYQFTQAFAMDVGTRLAYQVYQGVQLVPFTYAAFVGMTFGLAGPLN